jgi:hypothetical protein
MDFAVTRAIISSLPGWVDQLTSRLPPPTRHTLTTGSFAWRHDATGADTLLVTKAVRIASGLRAAMVLADAHHTVEAVAVLRTVADFSAEVMFIAEGVLEGRFTKEQAQFIAQHHAPLARTPDEFAEREREYYVGRSAVAKAERRLAEKFGTDAELFAKLSGLLNQGYDSYVHGKYESAMELFDGQGKRFMMHGSKSDRAVCDAKTSIAGKLGAALNALAAIATVWKMASLADELRAAFNSLVSSDEDAGAPCEHLR